MLTVFQAHAMCRGSLPTSFGPHEHIHAFQCIAHPTWWQQIVWTFGNTPALFIVAAGVVATLVALADIRVRSTT
jgi:hypothetical protein